VIGAIFDVILQLLHNPSCPLSTSSALYLIVNGHGCHVTVAVNQSITVFPLNWVWSGIMVFTVTSPSNTVIVSVLILAIQINLPCKAGAIWSTISIFVSHNGIDHFTSYDTIYLPVTKSIVDHTDLVVLSRGYWLICIDLVQLKSVFPFLVKFTSSIKFHSYAIGSHSYPFVWFVHDIGAVVMILLS
jgi:hypothetical protein